MLINYVALPNKTYNGENNLGNEPGWIHGLCKVNTHRSFSPLINFPSNCIRNSIFPPYTVNPFKLESQQTKTRKDINNITVT